MPDSEIIIVGHMQRYDSPLDPAFMGGGGWETRHSEVEHV